MKHFGSGALLAIRPGFVSRSQKFFALESMNSSSLQKCTLIGTLQDPKPIHVGGEQILWSGDLTDGSK